MTGEKSKIQEMSILMKQTPARDMSVRSKMDSREPLERKKNSTGSFGCHCSNYLPPF